MIVMPRVLLVAVALYFSSFVLTTHGQATAKRGGNPEAAKVQNPVVSNPESVAQGKRTYQRMCSRCHGAQAKGDGSGSGGAQQPDLTDDTWDYGSSDGEIFAAIHDGTSSDMEGYAGRLSDTDIWNLVNYLRSIGTAKK